MDLKNTAENTDSKNIFEFFQFKNIFLMPPLGQIALITILYILTTIGCYFDYKMNGTMYGYPIGTSMLFVPIYEELIFRGIILKFFEKNYGKIFAIIITSILFGLWHLKNIFWIDTQSLTEQIAFATFIFGPLTAWLVIKYRTLWPAVILHYLNNFPIEAWIKHFQ